MVNRPPWILSLFFQKTFYVLFLFVAARVREKKIKLWVWCMRDYRYGLEVKPLGGCRARYTGFTHSWLHLHLSMFKLKIPEGRCFIVTLRFSESTTGFIWQEGLIRKKCVLGIEVIAQRHALAWLTWDGPRFGEPRVTPEPGVVHYPPPKKKCVLDLRSKLDILWSPLCIFTALQFLNRMPVSLPETP